MMMIRRNLMSKNLKSILILFCIGAQVSCDQHEKEPEPETPVSKTYYVASNGDDLAVGSESLPLKSISKALTLTSPGDTVMVLGGTYYEKVRVTRSGDENKYITIRSFPG